MCRWEELLVASFASNPFQGWFGKYIGNVSLISQDVCCVHSD